MTKTTFALAILTTLTSHATASPNDHCPGLPFVYEGFLYECDDAQALLVGCADNDDKPIFLGRTWESPAGAFPNGTTWGFTMKCVKTEEDQVSNIPVACYVDDYEIAADDTLSYQGNRYHCEQDQNGKLTLTFKPICQQLDCGDTE